ncbi:hypothetical protein PCANC_06942 [Puccinia coronata f. sp. avenae]|uniref:Uncharacterized protein n=1 Tax=Puccinia coronata f. sp. avenae TaxID=200324 RepID=A0A2N5VKR7_9BASI|nr:hypothetical protein PCANC_06942 [Puccinia coronata f. sp. avenae]
MTEELTLQEQENTLTLRTELLEQLSHLHITDPQPIRLICEGCDYSLFHPLPAAPEEDQTMLLSEPEYKELYFAPLHQFIQALHHIFPNLHNNHKNEIVLDFPTLEIKVPEDNMYSKQLSLFDIDRLHVGANLPDHLLISLDQQPRLVHRFNILAAYVSELEQPQQPEEEPLNNEPEEPLTIEQEGTMTIEQEESMTMEQEEILTIEQEESFTNEQEEPSANEREESQIQAQHNPTADETSANPPSPSPSNSTLHHEPELVLVTAAHQEITSTSDKNQHSATTTTISTSLPLLLVPDYCPSPSSSLLTAPVVPSTEEDELGRNESELALGVDLLESEDVAAGFEDYVQVEETEVDEPDMTECDVELAAGQDPSSGELDFIPEADKVGTESEVPLVDHVETGASLEFPLVDLVETDAELEEGMGEDDWANIAVEAATSDENQVRVDDQAQLAEPSQDDDDDDDDDDEPAATATAQAEAADDDDHDPTMCEYKPDPDQLLLPDSITQLTEAESLIPSSNQAGLIPSSIDLIALPESLPEELVQHRRSPYSEFAANHEPDENVQTNDLLAGELDSYLDETIIGFCPESADLGEDVEESGFEVEGSCPPSDLTVNGFEHLSEGQVDELAVDEEAALLPDDKTSAYIPPGAESHDEFTLCPAGTEAVDELHAAYPSVDYQLPSSPETTLVSISRPLPQLGSKRNFAEVQYDLEMDQTSRSCAELPDCLLDAKKTRIV